MTRKSQITAGIVRILVASIALFAIVYFSRQAAIAAGFTVADKSKAMNNLIEEFQKLEEDSAKQIIIDLHRNTALVAFNKDSDFECYGCAKLGDTGTLNSRLKRPNTKECQDSSCICTCLSKLEFDPGAGAKDINCEKYSCEVWEFGINRKTKFNIRDNIDSTELISSWKGGFIYGRNLPQEISGYEKEPGLISAFVEKKTIDGTTYYGLCPELPCIT